MYLFHFDTYRFLFLLFILFVTESIDIGLCLENATIELMCMRFRQLIQDLDFVDGVCFLINVDAETGKGKNLHKKNYET